MPPVDDAGRNGLRRRRAIELDADEWMSRADDHAARVETFVTAHVERARGRHRGTRCAVAGGVAGQV